MTIISRGEIRPISDLPDSSNPSLIEVEDADGTARQLNASGIGGGGGMGPLPSANRSTTFSSSGNLSASPITGGGGTWTAWEYTGAANGFTCSSGAVVRGTAPVGTYARTNADVCSAKMVAGVRCFRNGTTAGEVGLAVGLPNTAIGSWTNRDFVTLRVLRSGLTTVQLQVFWVNGLGASVALSGTGNDTFNSGTERWFFLRVDGGLIRAYAGATDNVDAATLLCVASMPFSFIGPTGLLFPSGRRGGFYTTETSTVGNFYPTAVRFQTFT